ncbi:MAG: hypothetical protein LBU79_04150 [Planctomycetota bacterium]|jgi:hypothetical protein|nr:hypothetical protein [Planctomycetota bacterium]
MSNFKLAPQEEEKVQFLLTQEGIELRQYNIAVVLHLSSQGWEDSQISITTGLSLTSIAAIRKRVREDGLEETLEKTGINGPANYEDPHQLATELLYAMVGSKEKLPRECKNWPLHWLARVIAKKLEDGFSENDFRRYMKRRKQFLAGVRPADFLTKPVSPPAGKKSSLPLPVSDTFRLYRQPENQSSGAKDGAGCLRSVRIVS